MTDLIAADLLADISAALDERLDHMRAVDFARAVTRKGIPAEEIADLVRRYAAAREDVGDGDIGTLADGWLQ